MLKKILVEIFEKNIYTKKIIHWIFFCFLTPTLKILILYFEFVPFL